MIEVNLDAKALLRANKNKTKVEDFPKKKKVKKLANVEETLITKEEGDKRIRITAGTSKYIDKSTGEVKDINKSLVNQSNGQVSATQNAFGIHIEKTLNSKTGVLFDDGFHKVNMFPILPNGKKVIGEVDSKHSNKILFKDFVENDTLEYIVQENGLKENIIIPCMRDTYSYQFKLLLDNLEAEFNENAVHFFDLETREKIFVMGNLFMYDQAGECSKSIDMQLKSNTQLDYDLIITPNVKWINSDKRKFPVTIDPQIQVVDTPVLSLTGYRSGYPSPAINNKLVLGVKNGTEHKLKLILDTESIVSELARNNIQKYTVNVELHYLTGKRLDTSKGFVIYNNSTLLMKDLMKNDNNILSIDVTSLVEAEMEKYLKGRDLSSINLQICYADAHTNVLSDGTTTGIKITDDYVYVLDRLYEENSMRPEIQLNYIKKDDVVEGTPFLEYENGKSGKTAINIFNKSLSHTLNLGSIEANALKIDIGLLYDSRLKKDMEENSHVGLFGKGWMLNVNQSLVKGNNYNKLLGSKDVTYIDGNNNPHTLREKWYYEKDGVRHYILKELVFIDNDQKMKYLDEKTSDVYEVEYEVSNDEGLSLISTNSKMNYIKKSDMKFNRKYYILLSG
ncbi:MAG TPA: hypothetical protein PKV66_05450, partial [Candidatus Pelethenecus sp.]|nr:hypothetical protein [Candidatus Pelethenecus sp.]